MKQRYTVAVSREASWWVGEVADIPGAATEVAHLADLEVEVRDLLVGLLDADDDDFDLSWDLPAIVGSEGQAVGDAYRAERDSLTDLKDKVGADRLATLKALAAAGVPMRDSAALVGLSHHRVAQLLSA